MAQRIRLFSLLALGASAAFSVPAAAQCGYGTSSQDCYHQQRDAEAARQAEYHYRTQMQGDGGGDNSPYYDSGPSAPPTPSYGYVVVVRHNEATDVWATWNRRTEEDATASAMSACRSAMGEGCSVALSAWNSTIAVAQGSDGDLAIGWGAQESEAAAKALENCRKRTPTCSVKQKFTAKPFRVADDHYPGASVPRAAWLLVGWPKSRPADEWLNKVWLASGQGDYVTSESRLLGMCKRDTGIDCQVSQVAMGDPGTKKSAVIVSYWQAGKGTMWAARASREDAERELRTSCTDCTDVRFYDPFVTRLGAVDSLQP